MRSPLAAWRAGGASHCRPASSNCWLGCVGSTQLPRFQCTQHVRTHGGPNYSLKSDRRGVACGTILRSRPQRPLSSTVRPRNQLFSCVSRSPQRLVFRFAHCSRSAFSLLLSLGCAGLRVALGSSTWRARKIMCSRLAAGRARGACHCRSALSSCWLGCVGGIQLRRLQCSRHFRTLGGPNYSLKSDRCGVACATIMRSRPQRPLSSTVRPHRIESLLVVFDITAPDTGTARPACAAGAVSQLGALSEKPASHPAARAFCAQASPFRFASALWDLCCNRA